MKEYHKNLHKASLKADLFLNRIFSSIEVSLPDIPSEELSKYPTMVVSSHRSHMDYILIGIELDKAGMKNLRFAAGDNLTNMPYVGKVFRSWGAFSVYRAQAMKRSYISKLSQQVVGMLEDGDNIIVFPEGGRSYKGNMMDIKGGIIAANIFAQHSSPGNTYNFLPIAISYERLPEILYFNMLKKGKALLKDKPGIIGRLIGNFYYFGADLFAFAKFLSAPKFKRKYGHVYIDIGKPIAVSDITDVQKNFNSSMKSEFAAHKVALQESSIRIKSEIAKLYRLLPMHFVAKVLKEKNVCKRLEAARAVDKIIKSIDPAEYNLKSVSNLSAAEIVRIGIRQLKYTNSVRTLRKNISVKNESFINYYAAALE